jgi:hypothetical protein
MPVHIDKDAARQAIQTTPLNDIGDFMMYILPQYAGLNNKKLFTLLAFLNAIRNHLLALLLHSDLLIAFPASFCKEFLK